MIWYEFQGVCIYLNSFSTHPLSLQMIRDIMQWVRVFLNHFFTHPLSFKCIRNFFQPPWMFLNYLNIHLSHPILISYIVHQTWAHLNCLNTHLLDDIQRHIFKQVNHFIHILRPRRGSHFMDYWKPFYLCFTFITLVLRFTAKIYVAGCMQSN